MFAERARFRLHHPVAPPQELVSAPAGQPNRGLADRIVNAFGLTGHRADAGPVWEPLLREQQGQLEAWLTRGDATSLAADLAALGRSEAAQGYFGGAGQHRKCAADPSFAQLLSAWTFDKLLSLAEAIGVVCLELPETGSWNENLRLSAADLWMRVQDRIGLDLSPPDHVGGFLGIDAGGTIVQMRVIESIYAAYRLRQLADARGLAGSVCEIGAGAGLTAYYAMLMGIPNYVIIDLPTLNAVQAYMLAGSKIADKVALLGEAADGKALRILPPEAFADLPHGSVDILFNQDSFPEIEPGAARAYLDDAAKLCIPLFLSINQEARLKTSEGHQRSVPELATETGAYRVTSRHRHWLRQGYVEELYDLQMDRLKAPEAS